MERWIRNTLHYLGWHALDPPPPELRSTLGQLEGWVSAVSNGLLFALKLGLGITFRSYGLIADAIHSLSDCVSSVVVVLGFRIARKPPDAEHPFGHARSEHIVTLVVGVLVLVAGFELTIEALMQAYTLLVEPTPQPVSTPWWVWCVLLLLIAAKELQARFSHALGRITRSDALHADGWHHHSDAISTAVVMFGLAGREIGWFWGDAIAGMIVGGFVAWIGSKIAWQAVSPLLGERAPPETLARLHELARSIPEVLDVHDISVHRYGDYHAISLHIGLSDKLDIHAMHGITELLELRILKDFGGQCVIHVDPLNLSHPLYHRVAEWLKKRVLADERLVEYRDLRLEEASAADARHADPDHADPNRADPDHASSRHAGEASSAGKEKPRSTLGRVELSIDPRVSVVGQDAIRRELTAQCEQEFADIRLQITPRIDFSAAALAALRDSS